MVDKGNEITMLRCFVVRALFKYHEAKKRRETTQNF